MYFYVSTEGNDRWSGRLAKPNADGADGPFATIERARDAVRESKQSAKLNGDDITVLLRGGNYSISEPIVFTANDSAPVTYAAHPGEHPIIDGGREIKGWQLTEIGGKTAWVANLPEVSEGEWRFRQLFVNGRRCRRAGLPKEGFYWIDGIPDQDLLTIKRTPRGVFKGTDSFRCAPGNIQEWKNLSDVEVVVYHFWVEERMPIVFVDETTGTVRSALTSRMALINETGNRYAKYRVENVFEALAEPGEWYLDETDGRLYYIPLSEDDIETAEVFAPVVDQMMIISGNPEDGRYIEHLRFKGITFRHCEWTSAVKDKEAHYAAPPQAAVSVRGAICLTSARYCAIEDCTVEHIGSYGIEIGDGCTANRVVGNEIRDMGAGGIKINGSAIDGPIALRTGSNRITDNHIHDGGHIFASGIGIISQHSFGNTISHNHIHHLYYSGISCGWVWGYRDSVSKDNKIEKNYIHHIGQGLMSDMGGIYTLGVQPGTVIRGNVIHDIEAAGYGGWGIYTDEGSSHILIEQNVCYNTNSHSFFQHYGRENIVRNNIFAFSKNGQISLGRGEEHNAFTFERNIVLCSDQRLFSNYLDHSLTSPKFRSNMNLFWDINGRPFINGGEQHDPDIVPEPLPVVTMDEWMQIGNDRQSLIANPRFRSPEKFDFTLLDDSPAFGLGFQPINTSDVGPRPTNKRD